MASILSKIKQREYNGLQNFLYYAFQGSLGIPQNPKVLNIGGVGVNENEALYKALEGAIIDVIDIDEKLLRKASDNYVHRKIHTNAVNIPVLYMGGIRYDVIFSRHPPVLDSDLDLTKVGEKNSPTQTINLWDSVLRQLHFGNPGGLTLMTFYRENEYCYAMQKLAEHKPLKHGRNPYRTVFSKSDSKILFEAGLANQNIEIVRDNYYLLARNTCTNPTLSGEITISFEKNDSLTSEFKDALTAFCEKVKEQDY